MDTPPERNVSPIEGDIQFISKPADAQTVFVDGARGALVAGGVARISFFEQVAEHDKDGAFGRHILNLALPLSEVASLAQLLQEIAKPPNEESKAS